MGRKRRGRKPRSCEVREMPYGRELGIKSGTDIELKVRAMSFRKGKVSKN